MNFTKFGKITKNKSWELQICNIWDGDYFNFKISWSRKCDHEGFNFFIDILGNFINFKIYDNRHWDYKNNKCE